MISDMDILRRAWDLENDSRDPRLPHMRAWEFYKTGASRDDVKRLMEEGLITLSFKSTAMQTRY